MESLFLGSVHRGVIEEINFYIFIMGDMRLSF